MGLVTELSPMAQEGVMPSRGLEVGSELEDKFRTGGQELETKMTMAYFGAL